MEGGGLVGLGVLDGGGVVGPEVLVTKMMKLVRPDVVDGVQESQECGAVGGAVGVVSQPRQAQQQRVEAGVALVLKGSTQGLAHLVPLEVGGVVAEGGGRGR